MLEESKRRELLDLSKKDIILAVRAWKRRSANVSIVIDAEVDANEYEIFAVVNTVLEDASFKWIKSDQKKSYIQTEYFYKGDGYSVKIVFVSIIKQAV